MLPDNLYDGVVRGADGKVLRRRLRGYAADDPEEAIDYWSLHALAEVVRRDRDRRRED
jgi:hypothetical protein